MVAAVHFPAMAGLAVVADPLVRLLLTEKWLALCPLPANPGFFRDALSTSRVACQCTRCPGA